MLQVSKQVWGIISNTTIINPIYHINVSDVTTRSLKATEDEEEKTTDNEPMIEIDLEVREIKKKL